MADQDDDALRELESMRTCYAATKGLDADAAARVLAWVAKQNGLRAQFTAAAPPRVAAGGPAALADEIVSIQHSFPQAPEPEPGDASLPLSRQGLFWLQRLGLDPGTLDEVVHVDGDRVEYLVRDLPGGSKREKCGNAYLLVGAAQFILFGKDRFADEDARKLCRDIDAYDQTNHSSYMKAISKLLSGTKEAGFMLTGPGKRAAGDLLSLLLKEARQE